MPDKDLSAALFLDTLKDIYYAEKQIYKALPKMAKAANSDQLRAAFEKHHDETEGQIGRLEQIFELMGKPARGKKCDAIEGILVGTSDFNRSEPILHEINELSWLRRSIKAAHCTNCWTSCWTFFGERI
jgi:ferritin-like metal-binding protein YciE